MSNDTRWRKSRHSGAEQNACVELDRGALRTRVRDSKAPAGGALSVGPDAWEALARSLRGAGSA